MDPRRPPPSRPVAGCGRRRALLPARALAVVLGVGLTALPAPLVRPLLAQAADDAAVRRAGALATEAKLLFQQKVYDQAAERFMEAFSLVKRPALLFNAARAYEEGGLHAKAVALFRAYQGLADAPADGKADAAARIQRLEALLAERKAAEEAKAAEAQRQDKAEEERKQALQREAEANRQAERERQALQAQQAKEAQQAERDRQAQLARQAEEQRRAQPRRAQAPTKPAQPPLPWVAIASTSVAAVGSAVLYGLALTEQAAADDLEPHLKTQADKQTYLDHAANYDTYRYSAIGVGIVAAGLSAWAGYELYQRSAGPARVGGAGWQLQLLPTGLAVAF